MYPTTKAQKLIDWVFTKYKHIIWTPKYQIYNDIVYVCLKFNFS